MPGGWIKENPFVTDELLMRDVAAPPTNLAGPAWRESRPVQQPPGRQRKTKARAEAKQTRKDAALLGEWEGDANARVRVKEQPAGREALGVRVRGKDRTHKDICWSLGTRKELVLGEEDIYPVSVPGWRHLSDMPPPHTHTPPDVKGPGSWAFLSTREQGTG